MDVVFKYRYLVIVLLILFLGRLTFLGYGHLEDTDEGPYYLILENFKQLRVWNIDSWNSMVFFAWSNYIESFIRFIQTFFLHVYADTRGIPYAVPESLAVIAFFNILFSICIGVAFYKILRVLKYSRGLASLGVLVLGAFFNQNLYIRHILPYDSSFFFHLVSICILLSRPSQYLCVFFAGVLGAIGFFNYYGNFPLYIITYCLILYTILDNWKLWLFKSVLFASPLIGFFLFFQYLSVQSGESYWLFLKIFTTTIFHGSPEESLVFIYKYFYEVEGVWGICSLVVSVFGSYVLLKKWMTNKNDPSAILVFSSIAVYVIYAVYAYATGEFVFYGRVVHLFYPFIVIGIIACIHEYRKMKIPLVLGAVLNFANVVITLNSLGYPRSMIYEFGLYNKGNYQYQFDLKPAIIYDHQVPLFEKMGENLPKIYLPKFHVRNDYQDSFLLKNFGFFYHYPDTFMKTYKYIPIESNGELLVSRLHFMSFPAYTYEYCTQKGRAFLQDKSIKVSVLKL